MALSQGQLQALLDRIPAPSAPAPHRSDDQQGQKAPELSSVNFQAWRIWRKRFVSVVQVNQWSNNRARQEMSIRITGDVRTQVDEVIPIPDNPNDPALNLVSYLDTLDDIERKLIPESDCDMTRARFEVAAQESHEDLQAWHDRIRFLWLRVNPDKGTQDAEADRGLIHRFIIGLACAETKKRTWDTIPRTMKDALTRALNVQASIDIFASQDKKVFQLAQMDPVPKGAPEIHELGTAQARRCYGCDRTGHLARDCRWLAYQKQRSRGANRGGFPCRPADGRASNANRGRGNPRGRGRRPASRGGFKKPAAIEQLQEMEPTPDGQTLYVEEETSGNE